MKNAELVLIYLGMVLTRQRFTIIMRHIRKKKVQIIIQGEKKLRNTILACHRQAVLE